MNLDFGIAVLVPVVTLLMLAIKQAFGPPTPDGQPPRLRDKITTFVTLLVGIATVYGYSLLSPPALPKAAPDAPTVLLAGQALAAWIIFNGLATGGMSIGLYHLAGDAKLALAGTQPQKLLVLLLVLLVSCSMPAPKTRIVRTDMTQVTGLVTQIASSGCASTSTTGILDGNGSFVSLLSNLIPPELTQSGVTTPPTSCDFAKTLLSAPQAAQLQILFQYFGGEILLDGVHNLNTCPILAWGAQVYNPYEAGSITGAQYAKGMLDFLSNKFVQNLNGAQASCQAALVAAGLPVPSGYVSLP